MSGPPQGPGVSRAMSVGNGPPSAGLPPHNSMPPQQNAVPPPAAGSAGPQSQQNLNQIVSAAVSSPSPFTFTILSLSSFLPHSSRVAAGERCEHNSFKNHAPTQPAFHSLKPAPTVYSYSLQILLIVQHLRYAFKSICPFLELAQLRCWSAQSTSSSTSSSKYAEPRPSYPV